MANPLNPLGIEEAAPLPLNIDNRGLRDAANYEIANSSQFNRGWNSAGLSEDANSLLWKARNAYAAGDQAGGAVLEQQGRDVMQQSQQWAPTVRDFTDINSVGSAVDWAGGALGNVRSSVMPAVGGLAGAAIGAVAAPFTGGVINPVTGARTGAFLAGYNQMTEAEAGKAMLDDQIRDTRTMDEIGNASRMSGVVQGALESVVPGSLAKSAAGLTAKEARAQILKDGVAKTIGKKAASEGAQEFATEFAQNPVGDVTQNYLREDPLDNVDWKGAFNAGMAGMVAGGGMGIAGAGADVAHAKLQSGAEKVSDTVGKVKSDPLGTVLDAGVDLATKAGELKGKFDNYLEDRADKRSVADMKAHGFTDEEIAEVQRNDILEAFKSKSPKSLGPDDEVGKNLAGNDYVEHRKGLAKQDAIDILNAHKGDATPEMKQMATDYIAGKIEVEDFMAGIGKHGAEHKEQKATDSFLSGLGQNSKKSMMKPDWTADQLRTETAAESRSAVEATKTAKINTLADILVRQGASETLVKSASDSVSSHQLPRMIGLMSWISEGMKSPAKAVDSIAKLHGKGAEAMFGKAYTMAVNNGLIKPNETVSRNIKQLLKFKVDADTKLRGSIASNLSDIAKSKVDGDLNDSVEQLVPVIGEMVAHGMSKKQEAFLIENVFGTEERLYNVINTYVESGLHKQKVSKATGGGNGADSTQSVLEDDAPNDDIVLDSERDFEESRATKTEIGSTEKSKHYWQDRPNVKEGKAGNQYFDTRNAEHKTQLADMSEKLTAASGEDDSVRRSAVLTGKIAHELEKARQEKAVDVLPNNTRDSIIRSIVHEHYPKLERLSRRPKDVNDFTMKEYDKRKAAYERKVKFLSVQIDKRYKTLRIDQQESTKLGTDFDKADLAGLRLHRDLRDTKNGVNNGTVVLETTDKDGKVQKTPFITSTQMIVAKMLKIRDNSTESSKEYKGTAQFYAQLVNDGITSILQNEGFTGRFGTVRNGKIVWSLPHDMVVYTNKNTGERMTMGLARQQEAKQSANGSREFSSNEKRKALSDKSAEVSTEEAKSIGLALKNGGEQLGAAFEKYFPNGLVDNRADFDPSEVSEVDLETKELGLSAFDPDTEIQRDERGFAATNDPTMKAALMVGTTKTIDKSVERVTTPIATKATPERTGKETSEHVPSSSRAQMQLHTMLGAGVTKGLDKEQLDKLQNAIHKMPGLFDLLGNILHVAVAKSEKLFEGARALAQPLTGKLNGQWAIVFDANEFSLSKETLARRFAHEVAHTLEEHIDLQLFGRNSAVAKEAETVKHEHMSGVLRYPLSKTDAFLTDSNTSFESELHAQVFSLYQAHASLMKEQMPNTFAILEKQYGKDGAIKQAALLDERGSRSVGRSLGGDGQTGQQQRPDSGAAPTRDAGNNGAEQSTSEQLQTYLDEHGSKNAAWAGAAKRALAKNDETQIKNTLAAGKKQFGESKKSEQRAETSASEGAGNTGSPKAGVVEESASDGVNLVDKAKPPAFAKEKEQAKLNGADFIFAPTGVDGFAGRLAQAAKSAGKLVNPNGTENLRDKVVYVSVPGASRGFAGITEFIADVRKLLDRGAVLRTDTKDRASTPHNAAGEGKLRTMLALGDYVLTEGAMFDSWQKNLPRVKKSEQQAKTSASDEQIATAKANILKTIGEKINVEFEKMDVGSGEWTPRQVLNTIKLALNGDVVGAAFHESFHEFVSILKKNGGAKSVAILERAAMNPLMQRKLERLLDGHPEAQAQLKTPEEAAAFMYQFWAQGSLKIGPETRTVFQSIKKLLKKAAGFFSETFRKQVMEMSKQDLENGAAEQLLREFSEGAVANADTRQAVVAAMNKAAENHEAAVEHIGAAYKLLNDTAGKLVFSSEAMMDATGNKHMVSLSRLFHQKVGTAMQRGAKFVGSYSDGLRQQTSHWINQLEEALVGYDTADIEKAREHLSKGTKPTDRVAKEIVDKINTFYADMAKYIKAKDVRRLNMDRIDPDTNERGVWEEIPFRKDYFTQVWSVDAVAGDMEGFKAALLKRHMNELVHIAEQANKELKDMKGVKKGTAAAAELERADKEFKDSGKVMAKLNIQKITPEMIADAIAMRLLNAQGHIEIDEDTSGLGITPAASAVNKRQLDWLDKDVFDKYKEKDLTRIMSTYARNIVKRGEYQSRFGYGGEKIADAADKALLLELGGESLISKAEAALPDAKDAWRKAAAEARKGGEEYSEPYPTLRSVGQELNLAAVGQEKHDAKLHESMKKLDSGFKAIQAMEGTLGRDITPNQRAINSWLVTYQSFRTLSTMLFTSFQDVMGIVANGGEMGDAWKAFVSGIREIKNTVTDKKAPSAMMERAEFWGAVDGGAFLDSLGQTYGSPFMSGKAKILSDKFFKYTGAEGWNRGVRAVASQVAERIITDWKKNGIDTKDKAVVARVEDLFGKGFDVKNIKLDSEGRLDINDVSNQAAVTRWILTAVPAPTAAHRPVWGSDPHFQVFMHLKNYTYSFHRMMMKGAVEQGKLGNYRPAAAMALGYVPIAIAAGAIKEMLIPGDEPPWMKGGLDGYLSYGWSRAGVLGVPQMYAGALYDADPAALFGPTTDQLQNILSIPLGQIGLMRDHTMLGEGLGALPGGNLLKRLDFTAAN